MSLQCPSFILVCENHQREHCVLWVRSGVFSVALSAVLGCLFSFHVIENTSEGLKAVNPADLLNVPTSAAADIRSVSQLLRSAVIHATRTAYTATGGKPLRSNFGWCSNVGDKGFLHVKLCSVLKLNIFFFFIYIYVGVLNLRKQQTHAGCCRCSGSQCTLMPDLLGTNPTETHLDHRLYV